MNYPYFHLLETISLWQSSFTVTRRVEGGYCGSGGSGGNSWRNQAVSWPLTVLAVANVLFHFSIQQTYVKCIRIYARHGIQKQIKHVPSCLGFSQRSHVQIRGKLLEKQQSGIFLVILVAWAVCCRKAPPPLQTRCLKINSVCRGGGGERGEMGNGD